MLFLIALGSLGVISLLHSGRLELGHYVFLLPCATVVAVSAWLFVRSGTPNRQRLRQFSRSQGQIPEEFSDGHDSLDAGFLTG